MEKYIVIWKSRLDDIRSRINSKFCTVNDSSKDVPPEYTTNITDLKNVCVEHIFKYLSANDLAAMSQMCKKFKALAEQYFHEKFETDPIDIVAWRNIAKFEFKEKKEFAYEKCFASQIRSVQVNCRNASQMYRCFEFIDGNCPKNLVTFGASYLFIDEGLFDVDVNGEIIKDQLKNVKKVYLKNMFSGATFMRYCENVQSLEFIFNERKFDESEEKLIQVINSDMSWMNETYPKLRELSVFVGNRFELNLEDFFARNSGIDDIICSGLQTISQICQSDHQFRRATLILQVKYTYSNIFEVITNWNNNRGKCQELEISMSLHFNRLYFHEFALDVFEKLNSLRNLVAIHFTLLHNIDQFLYESKLMFSNVTKLCISNRQGNYLENAKALDEVFPNLEELELNQYRCSVDFENTFRNHMSPIVRQFKNLRKLKFKTKMQEKMKFNFAEDLVSLSSNRAVVFFHFDNLKTLIILLDPEYPIHKLKAVVDSLIEVHPFPDNVPADCKFCHDSNYFL